MHGCSVQNAREAGAASPVFSRCRYEDADFLERVNGRLPVRDFDDLPRASQLNFKRQIGAAHRFMERRLACVDRELAVGCASGRERGLSAVFGHAYFSDRTGLVVRVNSRDATVVLCG